MDASTHKISKVTTFIMENVKWLLLGGEAMKSYYYLIDTVSFRNIKVLEIGGEALVAQCVNVLNATGTPKRIKWQISCLFKILPFS